MLATFFLLGNSMRKVSRGAEKSLLLVDLTKEYDTIPIKKKGQDLESTVQQELDR